MNRVATKPIPAPITDRVFHEWSNKILTEIQDPFLTQQERSFITTRNASERNLLDPKRREYYRTAWIPYAAKACEFLVAGRDEPTILDLGAGLGTQALLLAARGAKVIALDLDEPALEIFQKRKLYYERQLGMQLDIQIIYADAMEFDYGSLPKVDGLFSLGAFHMIQPSDLLMQRFEKCLGPHARLAIFDLNSRNMASRVVPSRRRRAWAPERLARHLEQTGYRVVHHEGGACFPSFTWEWAPLRPLLRMVDPVLRRGNWIFPMHHLLFAERTA